VAIEPLLADRPEIAHGTIAHGARASADKQAREHHGHGHENGDNSGRQSEGGEHAGKSFGNLTSGSGGVRSEAPAKSDKEKARLQEDGNERMQHDPG
jgi:hypothetical protein